MAGFKDFQPAEVLTAADVNDFLMDQSVMVFDDAAARAAAIGTANFTEGMTTYNKDTAQLELFDGAAFVAVGGGAEPGLIHINSTTFNAVAAVNVNDVFSATYNLYKVIYRFTRNSGNADVNTTLRLRVASADNTTSNYTSLLTQTNNNSFISGVGATGTSFVLNKTHYGDTQSYGILTFVNPFENNKFTQLNSETNGGDVSVNLTARGSHRFGANTSFTGFSLIGPTNMDSGTVSIFGLKE